MHPAFRSVLTVFFLTLLTPAFSGRQWIGTQAAAKRQVSPVFSIDSIMRAR